MKRTIGLLLALLMYGNMTAAPEVPTASVVPGIEQQGELVFDDALLKEFDKLDTKLSAYDKLRLFSMLAKIKASEWKDRTLAHISEHQKIYIAGTVVLATLIIWWLWHHRPGAAGGAAGVLLDVPASAA